MNPVNMNPLVLISFLITLVGLSLILGAWIGFALRDKAIVSGETLRLPSGWLVHTLSQDMVFGAWSMTAVCITKNDEKGTCLCIHYGAVKSLTEVFKGASNKIKAGDFI